MEIEYQSAFLQPACFVSLFLRKKLTVTGINGKTQGVITATRPVKKQIKKICHHPPEVVVSAADAGTATRKEYVLLGNVSPILPNQLMLPVSQPFRFAGITTDNFQTTVSE